MGLKEHISDIDCGRLAVSISGVIAGSLLAAADFHVNPLAVLALIVTVLVFQLVPNIIPGILCALATVYFSYGKLFLLDSFILMALGYMSYIFVRRHAAKTGLFCNGPVFVLSSLLVYGIVPVFGAYYVCTHSFGSWMLCLPALSVGAMCLAARNAGNLHERSQMIWHTVYLAAGFLLMLIYACMRIYDPWHFLFVLTLPLFIWLCADIWRKGGKVPQYGIRLSLSILLFALLSGSGFIVYLL